MGESGWDRKSWSACWANWMRCRKKRRSVVWPNKMARRVMVNDMSERGSNLPPQQEAIRAKCFHPSGTFIEFPRDEIAQSIPERFEGIARKYPSRIAVKTR